ncbi:MAG: hypothetical protein HQK56_18045 [Deltaproteobacteria bacterium]|nr:hypothetical protein [Deltaproteobacteria bacterium]
MRTSNTPARKFSSTVGKIVMALVFASMIGGISIAPAFGEENYRRDGYHERYRHDRYRHVNDRRVYTTSRGYYTERVYAPPPVIYEPTPYQSPGISIVLPFN